MPPLPSQTHIACVFPGQGSQRKGMGRDLFDRYGDLCHIADQILGYSIRQLCLEDPGRKLRQTAFTQPALFVVNALTWLDRTQREPPPSFLAGHSLGEYNALFAAGCFDFATGLRLVQRRGALMAQVSEGGMAAVLGLAAEDVQAVLNAQGLSVDIANQNLPNQLVLSGPKEELESLIEPMEQAGAHRCLMLNVSGAFHSRHMAPCAHAFGSFLNSVDLSPPNLPVIANVTGLPYSDDVASHLVEQIRSAVRWSETMQYLHLQGVDRIEELGPGTVLQKLWARAAETWTTLEEPSRAEASPKVGKDLGQGLGNDGFRQNYGGLRLAYVVGTPMAGIRTPQMVAEASRSGLLSFLDTFTPTPQQAITATRDLLDDNPTFGVSLRPEVEEQVVADALTSKVRFAEAVGYRQVTEALVRFRFRGAHRDAAGRPVAVQRLMAAVRRRSDTEMFAHPAPDDLVDSLLRRRELTPEEGEIARCLPMASDLSVLTGDGASSDLTVLLPSLQRLVGQISTQHQYLDRIHVGAAGALGTPEAIACAFMLEADFVQTGAINMGCIESGLDPSVRALLASLDHGDTVGAPSADGFTLGARHQVVKKGSFFAARAQKLYELFRFHESLAAIDAAQRTKLETTYFKRSIDSILDELQSPKDGSSPQPKHLMAKVFCWYLEQARQWTLDGRMEHKVNFHIPCDESMAAFNVYTADSDLQSIEQRKIGTVADRLMTDAADFLSRREPH